MKNFFLKYLFVFLYSLTISLLLNAQAQTSSKADRLENLLRLSRVDTSRVTILNALFKEYALTKPFKAKKYAEQALEISEKNKYEEGVAISAENIGKFYHSQGEYQDAYKYFFQALSSKQKQGDQTGIALCNNQIANTLIRMDRFDEAIQYYNQSVNINQSIDDFKGLTISLTNLGGAYYEKEDYDRSIEYHRQALNLADSLGDRGIIAINLTRLAETYFRMDENKDALSAYRQLLVMGQKDGDMQHILKAYQGISKIFAEEGEYKKAYENYQYYIKEKENEFLDDKIAYQRIEDQIRKKLEVETEGKNDANEKLNQQRFINYAIGAATVFLLIIIVILFRNNVQKQRINRVLERKRNEIELKNNKLEEQTKKIEAQNESINRKNATLEATFKEIERKNKDITASINYAKRIQESMLPRTSKITDALPEHFILFRPRDIVSGDFYWFAKRDQKLILAAVDCTGHGVPGAIMSMLGDSYLNQIINTQGVIEPDIILTELHKSIGIALNQQETNNQDGMDIALCVIDQEEKTLEFAGASRSLMIIQDGIYEDVHSSKLPIGGFQKDRPRIFAKHTFDTSKPTWFYIFSDGFQDQFGGPKGRKFAKSRLFKSIYENYQKPLSEQKEILNRILVDWMGKNRQMDDILVIGVKL